MNKTLDPIPLASMLPAMHLANSHGTRSPLSLWVMLLFLGVYILAVPFHALFENGGCHEVQCASQDHGSAPPAHDHKTCVLCVLADLALEMPAIIFALLLVSGLLFQIAVSFVEPMMRFPATIPPARAPPAV